mmetsp:Transcript_49563/g.152999  ORF Transcript_49563/g.152999 Transcript_49563/m.152999 type:complete len:171 (-) Transcript_49563:580-1092(-)
MGCENSKESDALPATLYRRRSTRPASSRRPTSATEEQVQPSNASKLANDPPTPLHASNGNETTNTDLPVFDDLGDVDVEYADITNRLSNTDDPSSTNRRSARGDSRLFRGNAAHLRASRPDRVARTRAWVMDTRARRAAPQPTRRTRQGKRAAENPPADGAEEPPLISLL